MLQIPKNVKVNVIKLVLRQPVVLHIQDGEELLAFLDSIFDLKSIPSDLDGYQNAYDQAFQALVRNDDWEYEYIFLERFPLTDDNNYFEKFVKNLLQHTYRKNETEIRLLISQINNELEVSGFKIVKTSHKDFVPIYEIQESQEVRNLPYGTTRNQIEFHVVREPRGRSNKFFSHKSPTKMPCLMLVFNSGWNDYEIKSEFSLFYYKDTQNKYNIGELKIMTYDEDIIINRLGDTFTLLSDEFCSVGQDYKYYQNLRDIFGADFESILFALKDVAFFPQIYDKFERHFTFINSLLRYDNVERIARTVKYEMAGRNTDDLYKFSYDFKPNFAEKPVKLEFEFDNDDQIPNRIYAFIGKNGTGKTQLMNALPMDISNNESTVFDPWVPNFGKVISVSYSAFDTYPIPKTTASFNYVYCGLRDEENQLMTDEKLIDRFERTLANITLRGRTEKWRSILNNFIQIDIIDKLFKSNEEGNSKERWKFDMKAFLNVKNILSSGQKIIFYIVSEIVSNIRLDSLILYDEPETHLHPNAITELMNTIYELVHEFESYCILATHSPLIIRELMSKNVFIVEKDENIPSVRRIGLESFGENLTVLTDEVFGNKDVQKQYKTIVRGLVKAGNSYEQILELLEFDNQPLSLNVRLFIKSQLRI